MTTATIRSQLKQTPAYQPHQMETPYLGLQRDNPRLKCSRHTDQSLSMSLVQEYYNGKGPLILSPGCRLK